MLQCFAFKGTLLQLEAFRMLKVLFHNKENIDAMISFDSSFPEKIFSNIGDANHPSLLRAEMLIVGRLIVFGMSDQTILGHNMLKYLLPYCQSSYQFFDKHISLDILLNLYRNTYFKIDFESAGIDGNYLESLRDDGGDFTMSN
jgi:hypothetical protein